MNKCDNSSSKLLCEEWLWYPDNPKFPYLFFEQYLYSSGSASEVLLFNPFLFQFYDLEHNLHILRVGKKTPLKAFCRRDEIWITIVMFFSFENALKSDMILRYL